ncbi:cytidine deaminase [Gemella haemolysans]|uniref:Cytidine deaminase n=1 Tax=Gemella haemolysans TaxID=1379 RepID=A0A133ZVK8_9BACL|nr:cytidine deaminase [Gemella haemolysans]KXB59470.1 cytidine deaminase [Gemella haemolysans]
MIKLIASDMDGTLLNHNHKIPKENVELINYAKNQGIEFVVATGRAYYEALPALNEENINCDVISFNGGIVYDKNGNIISITPMLPKDLYYTIEILKSFDISYQLYTKNTIYTKSIETDINAYIDLIRSNGYDPDVEHLRAEAQQKLDVGYITEVENIELYLNEKENPPIKIIAISNDISKLENAAKLLSENTSISVTSSGANNIEIMHKNATKGEALKEIAKIYGINLENAVAIGDNLNDQAMLDIVGYSVAMKNGNTILKEQAKYVTEKTNSEGGVADTIFKLIEENNEIKEDINEVLVKAAIDATKYAYVPYSNFKVGAAILAENGKIYTGCNIENASYSPTNCAERTAIFKAVSEGVTKFKKIAVVGGPNGNLENYCPPCGVCRQVISEFADEDFELILGTSENTYAVYNFFQEVLPLSFTAKELKK